MQEHEHDDDVKGKHGEDLQLCCSFILWYESFSSSPLTKTQIENDEELLRSISMDFSVSPLSLSLSSLSFSMSLRFLVLFCMLIKENFSNHFDRTTFSSSTSIGFLERKRRRWLTSGVLDRLERPKNIQWWFPQKLLDSSSAKNNSSMIGRGICLHRLLILCVFHRISFRLDRWIFHERWSIFFSSHVNTQIDLHSIR